MHFSKLAARPSLQLFQLDGLDQISHASQYCNNEEPTN